MGTAGRGARAAPDAGAGSRCERPPGPRARPRQPSGGGVLLADAAHPPGAPAERELIGAGDPRRQRVAPQLARRRVELVEAAWRQRDQPVLRREVLSLPGSTI